MIKLLKKDNVYRRDQAFADLLYWDCIKITTRNPNWAWKENMLQRYYIAVVSNGSMEFTVNKKHIIRLNSGSVLLISPNSLVSARECTQSSTLWLLSFECNDFVFFQFHGSYIQRQVSNSVITMFYQLDSHIVHNPKPHYYYEALLILILDEIKRHIITNPNKQQIYDDVCKYISDHISENLTVQTISDEMNYNKDYLSRIIKECDQSNIQQLIIEERLNTAKNLLRMTNYSCDKIALHIGLLTGNHFIKFFKYHTKESPGAYRSRYQHA